MNTPDIWPSVKGELIVFHDVSTKVHERGQSEGNTYNKRSYQIAKKIEADIANKFDRVVTLTQEDQLYLKKLGCIKEIHVIPPQVKILEKIEIIEFYFSAEIQSKHFFTNPNLNHCQKYLHANF